MFTEHWTESIILAIWAAVCFNFQWKVISCNIIVHRRQDTEYNSGILFSLRLRAFWNVSWANYNNKKWMKIQTKPTLSSNCQVDDKSIFISIIIIIQNYLMSIPPCSINITFSDYIMTKHCWQQPFSGNQFHLWMKFVRGGKNAI